MKLPRGVGQKTLRALRIVRDHPALRPAQFADLMWPDSPFHKVHYNCGPYGSTTGRGLVMSAGSYLGRMRKLELVYNRWKESLGVWTNGWYITEKGRDLLKEADDDPSG